MTVNRCHKVVILYCLPSTLCIYHFYLLCQMTHIQFLFLLIAKLFSIYVSIYQMFTFGNLLFIIN